MSVLSKKIPLWAVLLSLPAAFALGALATSFFHTDNCQKFSRGGRELREASGRFTSPLLECEVYDDQELSVLKPFKYRIEELLKKETAAGNVLEASVYFRDLNNGMWFGINEDKSFRPASMFKVWVMLGYFKLAETNPLLLEQKIIFTGEQHETLKQVVRPGQSLVPGMSYTVDDLIYRMIVYSDNNSAWTLVQNIDDGLLDQVLNDLDVNLNPNDPEHLLTAHSYAGLFRVLYNSTYLSRQYSEKALQLLSQSEHAEGLRAGLPPGTTAATKFGEWGSGPDPDIVQFHEFGIVYHPQRPYLIGVMTRGRRGGDLNRVLREISRITYEAVDASRP